MFHTQGGGALNSYAYGGGQSEHFRQPKNISLSSLQPKNISSFFTPITEDETKISVSNANKGHECL